MVDYFKFLKETEGKTRQELASGTRNEIEIHIYNFPLFLGGPEEKLAVAIAGKLVMRP